MKRKITRKEYENASIIMESLIGKINNETPKNDPDFIKFIEASDIVEAYEEIHYPIELPSLIDVIKLRMFEMNLKNIELAELLKTSPARVSEYLNGKREITLDVARRLHNKLNIDSDIILNG